METTHDCGPLPCERRYRLPEWTLLHRLLDHSAPHVPLAIQPAYPPKSGSHCGSGVARIAIYPPT